MKSQRCAARGIVMLSTADWDADLLTNKQHTARALGSLGFPVLYVESMGLRRPTFRRNDLRRIVRRLARLIGAPQRVDERVWRWSPPSIPLQHIGFIRAVNRWLVSSLLWYWVRRILPSSSVLWTYNPMVMDLLRIPEGIPVVYHCVDDIASQPGMPAAQMRRAEGELVRRADHVFVTSMALAEKWSQVADVTYDPNCVDLDHFTPGESRADDILNRIRRPRIGFVGAIASYKVDVQMLLDTFAARPDWNLVLVGPREDAGEEISRLLELANVHHLGFRKYAEVPSVMRTFDIGLIPARYNDYTRSMFPMKFFEYLACGVPVVATELESLRPYAHAAVLASQEKFEAGIQQVLDGEHPRPEIGLSICAENSYELRTRRQLFAMGWLESVESNG